MGGGTVKAPGFSHKQPIRTPRNLRTSDYIKNNTKLKFQMPWENIAMKDALIRPPVFFYPCTDVLHDFQLQVHNYVETKQP